MRGIRGLPDSIPLSTTTYMRTVVIEAWPWVLAVEFRLMFARPILGSERAYLLFTFSLSVVVCDFSCICSLLLRPGNYSFMPAISPPYLPAQHYVRGRSVGRSGGSTNYLLNMLFLPPSLTSFRTFPYPQTCNTYFCRCTHPLAMKKIRSGMSAQK